MSSESVQTENAVQPEVASSGASTKEYIGLYLNVVATFVVSCSVGINAVLLPITMQAEGLSNGLIGLILSLEVVASFVVSLFLSRLINIFRFPAGLVVSTVVRVIPLLLLVSLKGLNHWIWLVFLHGVGSFFFLILLQTWVNAIQFQKFKGLMVALYSTSISLGVATGPFIFPWLPEMIPPVVEVWRSFGLTIEDPENFGGFIISAVLSAVGLIPVLFALPMIPKIDTNQGGKLIPVIKRSRGTMFSVTLAGVSYFGVASFVTLYGLRNGLAVQDAALLLSCFMLGSLVLEAPLSFVSDFVDRRYVIMVAVFASIVCAVFLPIAIYERYQAWALLFVWGGIIGAVYSVALTILGERYEGHELVDANASYSLMEAVGGALGVVAIGFAMDVFDADGLPYIIMLAGIIYFSYALTRYEVE